MTYQILGTESYRSLTLCNCSQCGMSVSPVYDNVHKLYRIEHECPVIGLLRDDWNNDYYGLVSFWNSSHTKGEK